jgi:hypothetical protein
MMAITKRTQVAKLLIEFTQNKAIIMHQNPNMRILREDPPLLGNSEELAISMLNASVWDTRQVTKGKKKMLTKRKTLDVWLGQTFRIPIGIVGDSTECLWEGTTVSKIRQ